jgi:hypothetical protein
VSEPTDARRLAARIIDTADRIRMAGADKLDDPVVRAALHQLDDVTGDALEVVACEPADRRSPR